MDVFAIIEFGLGKEGLSFMKERAVGNRLFPTREQAIQFVQTTNPTVQWTERAPNVLYDGRDRILGIVRCDLQKADELRSEPQ